MYKNHKQNKKKSSHILITSLGKRVNLFLIISIDFDLFRRTKMDYKLIGISLIATTPTICFLLFFILQYISFSKFLIIFFHIIKIDNIDIYNNSLII